MMQNEESEGLLKFFVQILPKMDRMIYPEMPELQKKHGLNKTQIKTLLITGLFNGSVMKEIWEILNVTKGNLSILIDSLVEKGYVLCERQTEDRRKVRVYLTDKGKALYEEILRESESHTEDFYSRLKKKEQESLAKLLLLLG